MDPIDLSQLSLFPATTEQTLESRKRTAVEWAKGMSLEQYIERDRIMDDYEHARDGNLITWVLAPRSDPFTLDFMCSCETFRRVGIVARSSPNGQVKLAEVPSYGVASVYTPPSKRNRGYAAHMVRLVHWVLAPEGSISAQFPPAWGAPPVAGMQDAVFSVLYSDIGDRFYRHNGSCLPDSSLGWVTTGSINTSWSVRDIPSDAAQWKLLSKEDALAVWDEDARLMKNDVAEKARDGAVVCSFVPNRGLGRFSIERIMLFKEGLTHALPLETWGVQLIGSSMDAPLVFATWTLENSLSKTMVLTRLRATESTFRGLLARVMEFARQSGLETVETWNLPEELHAVAKELGGTTFKRKDHLSSIKWYGAEAEDEVQWLFNEKSAMNFFWTYAH
ncbi:hypothetical protein NM688_g1052 [Phlebia brevispora]|uniref:Uncharacterized protein n=1 Tax=Phlebia brevispora TaxID=194682 RepID=A0ACC1TDC1_9APHY|nr:hypothetical protein NM688_g1052 [Phlebia brevispora]